VVISVVVPCVFVGGHSGSLPSGGAAIGPWLAPARHTVTRLSDIQRSIDINNFPLPVLSIYSSCVPSIHFESLHTVVSLHTVQIRGYT
jgi:hypothetical protein